jgi:hypothetical protein
VGEASRDTVKYSPRVPLLVSVVLALLMVRLAGTSRASRVSSERVVRSFDMIGLRER